MAYEKFKAITEGIHNLAIALALIVGGAWTLYTFASLGSRQRAQDELFKQAVINISIDCSQLEMDNEYFIQANVKIVNQGKRNTTLAFDKPFLVYKLDFYPDGSHKRTGKAIEPGFSADSLVLRIGATVEYPFIIKVYEKGFYLLEFKVPLNQTEFEEHLASGGPDNEKVYWRGSSTIMVK